MSSGAMGSVLCVIKIAIFNSQPSFLHKKPCRTILTVRRKLMQQQGHLHAVNVRLSTIVTYMCMHSGPSIVNQVFVFKTYITHLPSFLRAIICTTCIVN